MVNSEFSILCCLNYDFHNCQIGIRYYRKGDDGVGGVNFLSDQVT